MFNTLRSSFPRLFIRFGVIPLLFIAGVQLFVLSSQTATFFAWTINPPLTAAFLGAGYWAALVPAYMARNASGRSLGGVSLSASVAATTMLGIATFLHLDKFHLESPMLFTRFVTWIWIIVYVVTPPIFLVTLIAQIRSKKTADAGGAPVPGWLRAAFFGLTVICIALGAWLFLVPNSAIPVWGWSLTPLTARTVGAWFTTFGFAALTIARAESLEQARLSAMGLLTFCVLQLVVLARYFSTMDWNKPAAWLFVLLMLAGGGCSLAAARLGRAAPVTASQAA